MDQLTLPPAAATADPSTSHAAAQAITASGHRQTRAQRAAALVRQHAGLTALELSRLSGWDRHDIAKGLADAEHRRLVTKGDARTCSISGHRAVSWRPLVP